MSEKTKSASTMFNSSLTTHEKTIDSTKINKPSLNRTKSITKFNTPVKSTFVKGNVKNLCRLFESSKTVKQKSTIPLNKSVIRLLGTEDRIVMYFTSITAIRRTYEDCYAVRTIFKGFRVWIDERDVSMDLAYRKELQTTMGEKTVALPQIFIMGKYVGGADVIKSLFEIGELAKILIDYKLKDSGIVCYCGDVRFVSCGNCCGSKKVFDEDRFKRCPDCNENGLIRCPDCSF